MQDYHKSLSLLWYMLYFTLFIKEVFQNSWRTTAPINSAPEIIFRGVIKKALMFPEDRSYQTQYFAMIFSSSLA